MTELDYLQEEAVVAKENLQDSCLQLGRSVKATAADVWRKHPVWVGAAAAGLAGLGVVWILHNRRQKTTRTYVSEVEAPRGRSLFARAGGFVGKMLFSLILAKITAPPAEDASPSSEDLSGAEATA